MDHVVILRKASIKKGDNLLGDIINGTKTIESRWYVNRIAPWDRISVGDMLYFKESGCPVTAKAQVLHVDQYANLNPAIITDILNDYGKQIAPNASSVDMKRWGNSLVNKNYCILIHLEDVEEIPPFRIDKTGYGISSAWLVTDNIDKLRI